MSIWNNRRRKTDKKNKINPTQNENNYHNAFTDAYL